MRKKQNVVVGLDIGTTTISVVIAEPRLEGKTEIIGFGTSPSRGLRKGVIINIEATVGAIAAALQQAEKMAGTEVSSAYASLSGSHIKGINSNGIVGIKNREVRATDVERVVEAAKAVAIPLDREILHVLPQEFIVDKQDGIKEPLGMAGVRLEAHVHIITGAISSAQNVVKCANRCGLTINDLTVSPLASARAILSPEEQELGVAIIDIGGGTSDLMVFYGGAIRHTASLPIGGNHITNDIAAGLRTPIAAAEKIKCVYGTALANLVSRNDTIEVPSTGNRDPRVLSKLVLAEIIEPRVMELFGLLQKEIARAGVEDMLTSGIVLTGGGANLAGIAQVAEQVF